jgi:thiosulfate/3-mercaptopyruvate sulfurtransferase
MILLATLAAAALQAASPSADTMLVSTAWLAERLGDPKLVLFEIGDRGDYEAAHIPGARFLSLHDIAAPHEMGPDGHHEHDALALELPSPERLDSVLESHGVSDASRVVLYMGKDWTTPTARAYFTLAWAGLGRRVSVLDGGLPAWRAEGRAVSAEVPTPRRGSLTVKPQPELLADAAWIRARLRDPRVAVIDARDAGFYLDTLDNRMPRGGHIPGARNVPFTSLTREDGRILDDATLRARFRAAGAEPGDRVVVYCHIGQQGSWVWLVARRLGYDARLYDGSFQEWSARSELPVEGARRAQATPASRDGAPGR